MKPADIRNATDEQLHNELITSDHHDKEVKELVLNELLLRERLKVNSI